MKKLTLLTQEYFFNEYYNLIENNSQKKLFEVKEKYGSGTICTYNICPGLFISYSNYYIAKINNTNNFSFSDNISLIHHTLKGKAYILLDDGLSGIFKEGEIMIYSGKGKFKNSGTEYNGIKCLSMCCYSKEFMKFFKSSFYPDEKTIKNLNSLFSNNEKILIGKLPFETIEKINNLINLIENDNYICLKFKTLELLISHSYIYNNYKLFDKKFYKKEYIDKINLIEKFIKENYDSNITLSFLSKKFDINQTYLKEIFPYIYGNPPITYLREYRLKKAKEILEKKDITIIDLANKVGYSNPSKFSKVFKKRYGFAPSKSKKFI